MSRIGKVPVKVPVGVQVTINGQVVEVKGPKGSLKRIVSDGIAVEADKDSIKLTPVKLTDDSKALWGLNKVLIDNMVIGVSNGYKKELEIVGVGYKAEMKGKDVNIAAGLSSPVLFKTPDGIKISVDNQTKISIEGIDKEIVGQTAANIRRIRPPEPYKGKGIRYMGEQIRRKAGKTAGK